MGIKQSVPLTFTSPSVSTDANPTCLTRGTTSINVVAYLMEIDKSARKTVTPGIPYLLAEIPRASWTLRFTISLNNSSGVYASASVQGITPGDIQEVNANVVCQDNKPLLRVVFRSTRGTAVLEEPFTPSTTAKVMTTPWIAPVVLPAEVKYSSGSPSYTATAPYGFIFTNDSTRDATVYVGTSAANAQQLSSVAMPPGAALKRPILVTGSLLVWVNPTTPLGAPTYIYDTSNVAAGANLIANTTGVSNSSIYNTIPVNILSSGGATSYQVALTVPGDAPVIVTVTQEVTSALVAFLTSNVPLTVSLIDSGRIAKSLTIPVNNNSSLMVRGLPTSLDIYTTELPTLDLSGGMIPPMMGVTSALPPTFGVPLLMGKTTGSSCGCS